MHCDYIPVTDEQNTRQECSENHISQSYEWKPLLRQLLICTGVWTQTFQFGLCLGAPTVIIPRMREDEGEDYISQEMASWMSSVMSYAAIPWPLIIGLLSSLIGRRYTFGIGVVLGIVGYAVLSAAESPHHVLVAMAIQGPLAALEMTITPLIITEYTSPQYRGVFLTIKATSAYWGIWVANAIGTVAHWHYIAWIGLVCGVYNILTLFLWPESPYWLASKGRIQQCRKAHTWLKGYNKNSEKELQELLSAQQTLKYVDDGQSAYNRRSKSIAEKWMETWQNMRSKCFYKPLLFNAALVFQYHVSGKLVCSVYAIDIIKGITKIKKDAYTGMLILDGVTLLGMYTGCGLAKKLTRRMLLFSASCAAVAFLLFMSLYLFLVRFEVFSENKFVTISILIGYSVAASCGPILSGTIGAELLPLRLRSTCSMIVAIYVFCVLSTIIKVAPFIFTTFGMHGTFLLYGLMSLISTVLLYIYLPETKDKSLTEIEKMILGNEGSAEQDDT